MPCAVLPAKCLSTVRFRLATENHCPLRVASYTICASTVLVVWQVVNGYLSTVTVYGYMWSKFELGGSSYYSAGDEGSRTLDTRNGRSRVLLASRR